MKVKLAVSKQRYQEVADILTRCGLEIDEDAEFTLLENNRYPDRISVRALTGERVWLLVDDIVLLEAFGHTIEVHTHDSSYRTTDRLYRLLDILDPDRFLRVSNSAIIARDQVSSISPTLFMKFVLTMKNGKQVDVTRSYYYSFKDYFGI